MCLIFARPCRDLSSFSYLLLILPLRESYRERQMDREVFWMKDCGSHGRSVFLPRTGGRGPETCPESSTPTVLFGVIFFFSFYNLMTEKLRRMASNPFLFGIVLFSSDTQVVAARSPSGVLPCKGPTPLQGDPP